jgi:hypothetical protein
MAKTTHGLHTRTTLQTLQQGAAEHGVPYTTLRDLVLQGHLPRVQLGDSRRIWVKRADLDRLIATSTERVTR